MSWGTEGFLGQQTLPGATQDIAPALILMGDWCAVGATDTPRTKCADLRIVGSGEKSAPRGAGDFLVVYTEGLMGDPISVDPISVTMSSRAGTSRPAFDRKKPANPKKATKASKH